MNDFGSFKGFLQNHAGVKNNHITYLERWVKGYLKGYDRSLGAENISSFLTELGGVKKVESWQIDQAAFAISLYKQFVIEKGNTQGPTRYKLALARAASKPLTWTHVYEKVSRIVRVRHLPAKTETCYLLWIKKFVGFLQGVQPGDLDSTHVEKFINYLTFVQKITASTRNQAFYSLLFMYRNVLHKSMDNMKDTHRARESKKIPVVFSKKEISRIYSCMDGQVLLVSQLLYGCGLRIHEALTLRIKDLDLDRMSLQVHRAKGNKDRVLKIPDNLKTKLKKQMEVVKKLHEEDLQKGLGKVKLPAALDKKYSGASGEIKWQWVFPAAGLYCDDTARFAGRHHLDESNIQKTLKKALARCGIQKQGSPHSFRHSYATHLLESGVDIRTIQQLLGHDRLDTTMIYTSVANTRMLNVKSPLDALAI